MTNLTAILLALIAVESGGDTNAVNGDCVGVLQIRPGLVAECNRILGREEFALPDRASRVRSLRMARVFFGRHARPEWTPREYALAWRCGITGMLNPNPDALDYAERVQNLAEK